MQTLRLDPLARRHVRLLVVHQDRPGMIHKISGCFPDINIRQMHTEPPMVAGTPTVTVMDVDAAFTAEQEKYQLALEALPDVSAVIILEEKP